MPQTAGLMRLRDRAVFYRSLSQLLGAGVPVTRALATHDHPSLAGLIERGATFTEALESTGSFPTADLRLLAIAEKSGRLDFTLAELADFTEQLIAMRRTILSGLAFPALILTVAAFVVPLPKLFIDGTLTGYLVSSVGFLATVLLLLVLLLLLIRSLSPATRDHLLRPLPIIGRTWRELDYWRIASSMEMLTAAGLGVVEALRETAPLCRSPRLTRALASAAAAAETRGEPVSANLGATGEFPAELVALWATGEQSGKLDEMLNRLAEQFAASCQHRMQELARWLPRLAYAAVSLYVIFQILRLAANYVSLLNGI